MINIINRDHLSVVAFDSLMSLLSHLNVRLAVI